MRYRVLALVVCLFPLAARGQEKAANPYLSAKIGDYLTCQMTFTIGDKEYKSEIKQSVIVKDDKLVILEIETRLDDRKDPITTVHKIDLTKPFNLVPVAFQGENVSGKREKIEEGTQKVKIGDKTYDCTWIS